MLQLNLGTGTARRIEEVVKSIQEQISDIKIKEIEKGEFLEASCADISKLIELTGWQPRTTLEEGINRLVKHGRNQVGG